MDNESNKLDTDVKRRLSPDAQLAFYTANKSDRINGTAIMTIDDLSELFNDFGSLDVNVAYFDPKTRHAEVDLPVENLNKFMKLSGVYLFETGSNLHPQKSSQFNYGM